MSELSIGTLDYTAPGLRESAAAHLILSNVEREGCLPDAMDFFAHFRNNQPPAVTAYGLTKGNTIMGAIYACHDFGDKEMAQDTGVEQWTAINAIAVALEFRRQGHARRMLSHVASEALTRGRHVVSLVTRHDHETAIFAGMGFQRRPKDRFMWAAAATLAEG